MPSAIKANKQILVLIPLILLYLVHFYYIAHYAVNVPYEDEWQALTPDGFPAGFTLSWIFKFHYTHRIVLTKLLMWAFFNFSAWNLAFEQVFNFLIFGLIIALFLLIHTRYFSKEFWPFPFFLLFLLSPLAYENHSWGFQSQFHFFLLFGLLGVLFAARSEGHLLHHWLAVLCGVMSSYSFSGGLPFGFIVLLFLIFRIKASIGNGRFVTVVKFVLPSLILAVSLALWFLGFRDHVRWTSLYSFAFWKFYFNLLALGFGQKDQDLWIGIFWFCAVIFMLGRLTASKARSPDAFFLIGTIVSILAVLGSMTMARTYEGLSHAKYSRYSEIGMMLMPLMALGTYHVFEARDGLRSWGLGILFALIFLSYIKDWDFGIYRDLHHQREKAVSCIQSFYAGNGDGQCPGLTHGTWPIGDLPRKLRIAQNLNLSFTRMPGR